jgi:F-type H+-transporting ATPase subunit a
MASSNPLSHVVQHPIRQISVDAGPLTPEHKLTVFSDHISMIVLAFFLLVLVLPRSFRRKRAEGIEALVPSGFGNGIEAICVFFRDDLARPNLGPYTDRFIKYIWSVFFFVLTLNLLGLLPIGAISPLVSRYHLGGTATANIWTTATLSCMTLFMMVFQGLRLSPKHFLSHLCPGPLWLAWLLIPLELVGFAAKTFALTVRLFANMVAGHTILAVLVSFILTAGAASTGMGFAIAVPAVAGSVAITFLEILVAFIQAFIFTFLTVMFIAMSVVSHDNGHDETHGEAHA